jgi:hypothetical protein
MGTTMTTTGCERSALQSKVSGFGKERGIESQSFVNLLFLRDAFFIRPKGSLLATQSLHKPIKKKGKIKRKKNPEKEIVVRSWRFVVVERS